MPTTSKTAKTSQAPKPPASAKAARAPRAAAPSQAAAPVVPAASAEPAESVPGDSRLAPTIEAVAAGLLFEATLFDKGATQGGRLKAWELLGKHLGMFKDRKEEGESVLIHYDFTL